MSPFPQSTGRYQFITNDIAYRHAMVDNCETACSYSIVTFLMPRCGYRF